MSSASEPLTEGNTDAFAHRITGNSFVYECPDYEFDEVLATELIGSDDARCFDCETCYQLNIRTVA